MTDVYSFIRECEKWHFLEEMPLLDTLVCGIFAGRTLYVPFRVNKYRYIIITLSSQCPFPQGAKTILGESAN